MSQLLGGPSKTRLYLHNIFVTLCREKKTATGLRGNMLNLDKVRGMLSESELPSGAQKLLSSMDTFQKVTALEFVSSYRIMVLCS